MQMKYKKLIIIGLCIFIIVLFFYIYLPGYSRYQELKKKEADLIQQIEEFKDKNEKIYNEIERLKNDLTHLEKVMRDEMGLVKPGEVVYKVVEEEAAEEELAPDTNSQ